MAIAADGGDSSMLFMPNIVSLARCSHTCSDTFAHALRNYRLLLVMMRG